MFKGDFEGDLKGDLEVDFEGDYKGDFRGDFKQDVEGDLVSSSGQLRLELESLVGLLVISIKGSFYACSNGQCSLDEGILEIIIFS